jgi:hypothetical protein
MNQQMTFEERVKALARARKAKFFPPQPIKKALTWDEVKAEQKEREKLRRALEREKKDEEKAEARKQISTEKAQARYSRRVQKRREIRALQTADRMKAGVEYIRAWCEKHGADHEKMIAPGEKGRWQDVEGVKDRMQLIYALRHDLGLAYDIIGQIMGGREHSTIRNAYQRCVRLMREGILETKTAGESEAGAAQI